MAHDRPHTLLECAAHVVGTIIAEHVVDMFHKYMNTDMFFRYISVKEREDLESHITRTAELFDEIIPVPLHDTITQHSLRCLPYFFLENSKFDINKLRFIDIILRSHTTTFDITGCDDMPSAMCKSLTRLKNLVHLKIDSVNSENFNHVTRAIKDMKKLKSVECENCYDEIMEVLCYNCPLRLLSLKWCKQVTDVSVPYILSLQSLEKLDIVYCGFSKTSYFKILSGLPNLRAVSTNYIQEFLAQINDDSVVLPFKSVKYFCGAQEGITNLTKYCPLITELDFWEVKERTSTIDLSGLATLRHLKSLKIHFFELEFSRIKPLLELNGYQLIELEIGCFKDASTESENKIRSLCPNLKSLDFKKYYFSVE